MLLAACSRDAPRAPAAPPPPSPPSPPPTYVGTAACSECHPRQAQLWSTSHHRLAMQPATSDTVLGNFRDARFDWKGVATTFLRRGEGFAVRTDGPDGKLAEFPVRFTFGIEPLQQYLVELPRGRLQCLGIAWDTRPRPEGGQRWFHLYPGELRMDFRNALHWTRPQQTWNHMCAECHTTDFRKGYRAEDDRFDSAYAEGNVGCEACHGPGSGHLAWARGGRSDQDRLRGLTFALKGASLGAWGDPNPSGTLTRTGPLSRVEVETCGPCHARRGQLWPEVKPGEEIGQAFRVALLDQGLYQADGQILDEVFEYGSFLQSKMYLKGVTCSDCHEPHGARKLRAEGNAVCVRCHLPAHFDVEGHTHHRPGSPGAQCVSCHMSMRLYMVVDGRRDHSFRIPRPDLAVKLGTPDACSGCHGKQGAGWSAEKVLALWGPGVQTRPQWAEAIAAGRSYQPGAGERLMAAADSTTFPGIVRATAVSLLDRFVDTQVAAALERAARDPDPLVRRAAAESIEGLEPRDRLRVGAPLLADPVRAVRLAVTATLSRVQPRLVDPSTRTALELAQRELRASLAADADRSDAQYNLGVLELSLGRIPEAEAAFRLAIRRDPTFAPSYLNLADIERGNGREREAEATLREGLRWDAGDAPSYHALGLSLVRQGRRAEALAALEKAARLGRAQPHFAYVYAVALKDSGDRRGALRVLEETQGRFPGHIEILTLLVQLHLEAHDADGARRWARKLSAAAPNTPGIQDFVQRVERGER